MAEVNGVVVLEVAPFGAAYRRGITPGSVVLEVGGESSASGEPYRQDYRMRAKDGRWVWFHDEAHLIRDADGEPLLVLTSGAHRVDTALVSATAALPALRRAKPDFVRAHTGQVIGGVSPIGHPAPIQTFVDSWLTGHDVVWAAAGHPAAAPATGGRGARCWRRGRWIDSAPAIVCRGVFVSATCKDY